ncbi:MAG TPA: PIN domain nuclease [Solirubrobacteraceae bacterium]|nr:PIN domain nuclease [Solirubrobacteraceae bacterium]
MILVDTSAWVEYLRATRSRVDRRLAQLIADDASLATTDVVLMEVLAGALDDRHERRLRALLSRCQFLATLGPSDYEDAARLYRLCRHAGSAPRKLTDCLIAIVAMRHGAELLQRDRDFALIARHSALDLA